MNISLILSIISLVISIIAVVFTSLEVWKNNFSKFKPLTLVGDLGIRVYPIKNGDETWFIPSLDVPINIANEAVCPGRILSIRIVAQYPNLPIYGNKEFFYPKWEIDAAEFNKYGKERFDWIKKAVASDWMPFIILPKTSMSKHIILEPADSWKTPVIQFMLFTMGIFSLPEKNWRQIGKWKFHLPELVWSELTENGTSFNVSNEDDYGLEKDKIYPSDLHQHTGTKNLIPKGGFKAEASYLAYPFRKNKELRTSPDKTEPES